MKQKIQSLLYPAATRLLLTFNTPWEKICNKLGREATLCQLKDLMKKKCQVKKTDQHLDIILVPYMACFLGNNMVQITLGRILKEMGHKVTVVLADRILPICETTGIDTDDQRNEICGNNIEFNERFFRITGFNILRLSELVSDEKMAALQDVSKNNKKWDVYVESMLLRYFKVGVLANTPEMEKFKARGRHAAFISEALGEAIVKLRPDRVAFSHGTYTTRGPFKDIVNEAGIPQFSISRAKMAETQKFNWKTSGDWWDISTTWEKVKDIPLNDKQHEIISTYLQSRRNHERDVMVYNLASEEAKEIIAAKLGIDKLKQTFTLFTNVLWDASSAQREVAFNNAVEWVIETIKWFADHPEKQLIIRIHPAEKIIGTNQPIYELIHSKVSKIPPNVIVLAPDAPVNSWSLLKITDVGLVHTSTVGMELALEGIPCACVSKTHYRQKGFTIDVNSREEYFLLLKNGAIGFDVSKCKEQALKYAYTLFMRYQLPLPFFSPKSHISINSFAFDDWKKPADSKGFQTIINSIENQSDFILPDEAVYELYRKN